MSIPPELLHLLVSEKFCFLATSYRDKPHLSLMNFTYLPEEEVVILSSRADTTKVKHMEKNPAVALLLYSLKDREGSPLSCTLHGRAALAEPGQEEALRARHYQKHRDMGTFINGSGIRIITVTITHAAMADARDRVYTWSPGDNPHT